MVPTKRWMIWASSLHCLRVTLPSISKLGSAQSRGLISGQWASWENEVCVPDTTASMRMAPLDNPGSVWKPPAWRLGFDQPGQLP